MKLLLHLLLSSILINTALTAQPNPVWQNTLADSNTLIVNIEGRNTQSLNGPWNIIIDPYEAGFYNYRYKESDKGWFKNLKMEKPSDLIEYNFDRSDMLNVPGDWNSQRAELLYYEGTIWYRKNFNHKKQSGQRAFLHFGAVNYDAKVYLNGEKIGEHQGGFTPFNFEVTDKIKDGENFVIVKADNKRSLEAVPTVNFDWWNYGGITRPVHVITTPATFIKNYLVQLKKGAANEVEGWIQLDGDRLSQEITVRIPEAGVSKKVTTNAKGYAPISFTTDLSLWSPENPKLYQVEIVAATDTISEQIGFRTIEVKGQDILLNGKSIFLRGVCLHEETAFHPSRAFAPEHAETLLGWAKEMGCNFVRLAHYPHNENMIRTADRMGILLWSEIPVYWTIQWNNPETYKNAENQLTTMINRDKNRASVILWSMANETPLEDGRLSFISNLADHTRKLDPTRLITAALENHTTSDGYKMIDDPLGAKLDVIGNNNYCGWYAGEASTCDQQEWKTIYNKPLIMSEFGGGALQGYHGNPNQRWTEEYQAEVYEYNIEMLKKIPFLRGTTPWILKDFRSPKRPLADIQDGYNRKGLISESGEKKKAFGLMKKYYEEMEKKFPK